MIHFVACILCSFYIARDVSKRDDREGISITLTILILFVLFFALRLVTLFLSIRNEKRLKSNHAVEFGKRNSLVLGALHVIFYLAAIAESWEQGASFNSISVIGVVLFGFSYIILCWVIIQLRDIWTLKIYIAKDHKINKNFLFKYFRHPNYFLNIIPELIGIGLLCHAWYAMLVLLPFYAIVLIVRIVQEERVMQAHFKEF